MSNLTVNVINKLKITKNIQYKKIFYTITIKLVLRLYSYDANFMILGGKGLEPSIAFAIEFTAQPVIPTNGTLLFEISKIIIIKSKLKNNQIKLKQRLLFLHK